VIFGSPVRPYQGYR